MLDRSFFVTTCDAKLKLVRAEAGLTQEVMAVALGISKKTLVDIEKGRRTLGWTGAVALCAVFPDSQILLVAFGGPPLSRIPALALADGPQPQRESPGNPWWQVVDDNGRFIIEQNVISQHYRLLSQDRIRLRASFDIDDLMPLFNGEEKE